MKTSLVVASLLASVVPAVAQPASSPPLVLEQQARPEPTSSINVSPLGLVLGSVAVTYEKLFDGTHGLILEAAGSRASDDTGSSLQLGGGVGYRWHWRGQQNSGFLGVMLAQGFGSGEVKQTTNGSTMTHAMSVRSTTLTANIGKRWMLGDHVNITLRFGLGWGNYVANAKSDTPGAKEAEATMNDLLAFFPVGFDGELSIGYAF